MKRVLILGTLVLSNNISAGDENIALLGLGGATALAGIYTYRNITSPVPGPITTCATGAGLAAGALSPYILADRFGDTLWRGFGSIAPKIVTWWSTMPPVVADYAIQTGLAAAAVPFACGGAYLGARYVGPSMTSMFGYIKGLAFPAPTPPKKPEVPQKVERKTKNLKMAEHPIQLVVEEYRLRRGPKAGAPGIEATILQNGTRIAQAAASYEAVREVGDETPLSADLINIAVDPRYRRQGYGTMVWDEIIKELQKRHVKKMTCDAIPPMDRGNPEYNNMLNQLVNWYKKRGAFVTVWDERGVKMQVDIP